MKLTHKACEQAEAKEKALQRDDNIVPFKREAA